MDCGIGNLPDGEDIWGRCLVSSQNTFDTFSKKRVHNFY